MFCTKLKDLKITGECPFSLLAPGQVPKESSEEVAGSSKSHELTQATAQEKPEKNTRGNAPQRKTSRSRVYLHTLAESICKLIFPEVSACLLRCFSKENILTCFFTFLFCSFTFKVTINVFHFLETSKIFL